MDDVKPYSDTELAYWRKAVADRTTGETTARLLATLDDRDKHALRLLDERDALRAIVERLVFAEDDPIGFYDKLAEEFYRATGLMAPGKSVPMEMASDNDEERRKAWRAWSDERRARLLAEYRAALGVP